MLSNRVYDFCKAFLLVVAPSASGLYLALTPIHNFAHTIATASVFMAISAVMGGLLLLSTRSYYQSDRPYIGAMRVTIGDDGRDVYRLEVDGPIELLAERSCVVFKVVHEPHAA